MEDCIFCRITSGDVGSDFIYEDDKCVIVNDINPKAKTHLLVISKEHLPSVADMTEKDEDLMGHMIFAARNIAEKYQLPGYKLIFNVGKSGGQEIFHVHLHLLSSSAANK